MRRRWGGGGEREREREWEGGERWWESLVVGDGMVGVMGRGWRIWSDGRGRSTRRM